MSIPRNIPTGPVHQPREDQPSHEGMSITGLKPPSDDSAATVKGRDISGMTQEGAVSLARVYRSSLSKDEIATLTEKVGSQGALSLIYTLGDRLDVDEFSKLAEKLSENQLYSVLEKKTRTNRKT